MNKADVLFLDIFKSIRGSWAGGIIWRGWAAIYILSRTTLSDELKMYFLRHFVSMIEEYQRIPHFFDGRSWSCDCSNSYDELEGSEWFDESVYKEHSIYSHSIYDRDRDDDDFEKFMERFPAFDGVGYMQNHIMAQLKGGEPDYPDWAKEMRQ